MVAPKEQPTVLVRLDPKTMRIAYKLPIKGAKWRKGFADLNAAMTDARKDLTPPWWVVVVSDE